MTQIVLSLDVARLRVEPIHLRTQMVPRVVLDTNVIIPLISNPDYCGNFLRWFEGEPRRAVVVDKCFDEVRKVKGWKKNATKLALERIFGQRLQVIRTTEQLQRFAYSVSIKHTFECHYPDTLMLVVAKWFGWTVATHDGDFLRTCKKEHISIIRPNGSGNIMQKKGAQK